MQNILKFPLIVVILSIFLFACGRPAAFQLKEKRTIAPACVYLNSSEAAPRWICGLSDAVVMMSAVGYAKNATAGRAYLIKTAVIDSENKLIKQIRIKAGNKVRQHLSGSGVDDTVIMDKIIASVVNKITDLSLFNNDKTMSKILETEVDYQGQAYVLVGIPDKSVVKIIRKAVLQSIELDPVLWQKFKLDQNKQEIAGMIAHQYPIRSD